MSPNDDRSFFELTAFLVSSARGALEEGPVTASLRLITAAERLAELAPKHCGGGFVQELGEQIANDATTSYLASRERYETFLDATLAAVAAEVLRRNGLTAEPGT
jgi:hypothetical protein